MSSRLQALISAFSGQCFHKVYELYLHDKLERTKVLNYTHKQYLRIIYTGSSAMKRKFLFADIALNISIVVFFLSVAAVVRISGKLSEMNKLNRGYYSSHRQAFTLNKKTGTFDDIKKIYSKCMAGTILYKELSRLEDLRGVLVKGDIDAPPVMEGRFFNENDFYSNKHIAVVGVKQKDRVYEKNGGFFIDIGGHPYEVIGIAGTGCSLLDYTIYINLDSLSEVDNEAGLFYLDGISGDVVNKSIEELKDGINVINLDNYGIINIFFGDIPGLIILMCILTSFLLSCLFFTYFWFYSHKKLPDVMNIIGMSRGQIAGEIFREYVKTILPAIFTAIVVMMGLVL